MKDKIIELKTKNDTITLAKELAAQIKIGDVIFLYGNLGSGKTFFVKALGKALGVENEISSPSFVLMNEYQTSRFTLYHLDLYRLKQVEELQELGLYDLIDSGVLAIEWPELAEDILPTPTYSIHFSYDGKTRTAILHTSNKLG